MKKLLLILFCLPLFFTSCSKRNWKPENTIKGYIQYHDFLGYHNANNTEVYLKSVSDTSILEQTTSTKSFSSSGKFEFNNIVNGEYYIYAYRESNLTSVSYDGYSRVFLVDGYTVRLDTLTLEFLKQ